MKIVLTSNLPSTRIEYVYAHMRVISSDPRIAFIPPYTDSGRERFTKVRENFRRQGFHSVDYYDIDEEYDSDQPPLKTYNIIFLSGGDPLIFRDNLIKSGVSLQLQDFADTDGMIVASSGGSMQLSDNLSLFRLRELSVGEAFSTYYQFAALGVVPYEFLPHLNQHSPEFLEKVRQYSEQVDHDIVAVDDGSALMHKSSNKYETIGKATIFRHGEILAPGA